MLQSIHALAPGVVLTTVQTPSPFVDAIRRGVDCKNVHEHHSWPFVIHGCHSSFVDAVRGWCSIHGLALGVVRTTVETPSTNLVRYSTLALLNMPSLSDTMINWCV